LHTTIPKDFAALSIVDKRRIPSRTVVGKKTRLDSRIDIEKERRTSSRTLYIRRLVIVAINILIVALYTLGGTRPGGFAGYKRDRLN
jgi:hypothetical protein